MDIEAPLILFPLKKNKQGQMVHSNQKLMIINLYKKLKEDNPNITCRNAIAQLKKETGFGSTTIQKTLFEYKKTGMIISPNRTKRRLSFKEKVDESDKSAIRKKVHKFYIDKELPTLNKVWQAINADEGLPNFKRTTFYSLLKELNFTYINGHSNKILTEKDDLIIWRRNYLRSIKKARKEGRQIYYLDETWIDTSDVTNRGMDNTVKSEKDVILQKLTTDPVNPSEKGKGLIILHIGSAAGFVPGGLLCFESKKNIGDYLDEINGDIFLEWFQNILPLLDDNAVIVMDNAPYHCVKLEKLPNSSWRKTEIMEWLEDKGIEVLETMVKAELLQIVQQQKYMFDKYVIDEIAHQNNKTILRLPPYHCELNPIAMVWPMVKEYVKSNNNASKIQDVKLLLEQGIEQVTTKHWRHFIKHVINEERKIWKIDHIIDRMVDAVSPSTIHITDETDSETLKEFTDYCHTDYMST